MTLSWEAAFLDLDGDGAINGLFRRTSLFHGYEFHETWFVDAANAQLRSSVRLKESIAREITLKHRLTFRQFDRRYPNRQFIEIVELDRKPYVLIGRAYYWAWEDMSRFPRVQVLERTPNEFQRVCLFDG